jgi:MYXO-CTERM domain-containing protein
VARVVYYCGTCKTSSHPGDGYDAEQARTRHRDVVHRGQIPDGEEIRTHEEPGESGGLLGCLAGFGALALLALFGWIKRHL